MGARKGRSGGWPRSPRRGAGPGRAGRGRSGRRRQPRATPRLGQRGAAAAAGLDDGLQRQLLRPGRLRGRPELDLRHRHPYNGAGCAASYGTGEVERTTSSTANVSEDGSGHLTITAGEAPAASWTSGRIETTPDPSRPRPGGEMEVTASIRQPEPGQRHRLLARVLDARGRVPGQRGGHRGTMNCASWPAAARSTSWRTSTRCPRSPARCTAAPTRAARATRPSGLGSGLTACSGCQTGYDTYSVIVNRTDTSDESITYYRDGSAYYTVTERQVGAAAWAAAVDHGFFIILDLALGGGYPDGVCGCASPSGSTSSGGSMSVGYVAVYTKAGPGPLTVHQDQLSGRPGGGPGATLPWFWTSRCWPEQRGNVMRQSVLALTTVAAGICVLAGCSSSSTPQASSSAAPSTRPRGPEHRVQPAGTRSARRPAGQRGARPRSSRLPSHSTRATRRGPSPPPPAAAARLDPGHRAVLREQDRDRRRDDRHGAAGRLRPGAPPRGQAALNREDSAWLAARATVCSKAYQSGGTIDGINIAGCLLDESTAWLAGVKGTTPAEAMLKSTDSPARATCPGTPPPRARGSG